MSLFTPYVKIYFNETASFGTAFVLNDATQGVLDNVTYGLADTVPVDVTSYVSGTISTTRGRSRETDQFQAGSASFTLRNEDRRFDPSNTASATGSALTPRLKVEIGFVDNSYGWTWAIFTGYIDDINVKYEQPNISEVEITCVDAFTILANQQLNTSITGGTPGAMIASIASKSGFKGSTNIADGYNTIQAVTFSNTDALTALQTIARSDNGLLFVDANGTLTYQDRYYTNFQLLFVNNSNVATFTDDQTAVTSTSAYNVMPYTAISQKSQALLLYNKVTGTRTGGTQQTAKDTTSIAAYQTRELGLGQLENASDSTVADLCSFLVGRYAQPEIRFDALTVNMNSLDFGTSSMSNSRQITLASIEIGSVHAVTRTPAGTGTPSVITKNHVIDGISWNIDASTLIYDVTFNLASMTSKTYLMLDDSVLGVLESTSNSLGY